MFLLFNYVIFGVVVLIMNVGEFILDINELIKNKIKCVGELLGI